VKNANDARRAVAVAAFLAGAVYAAHRLGVVYCPLRHWTGIPCPACGTVRATLQLLGGDITGAFAAQPLGLTVLLLGCIAFGLSIFAPSFLCQCTGYGRRHIRPLMILASLAVVANWAYVIFNTLCKR